MIAALLITMANIARAGYPHRITTLTILHGAALPATSGAPSSAVRTPSNCLELTKRLASRVFLRFAEGCAELNRSCEASAPINMWLSLDPASRDTSRSQRIISDCEAKGNRASSNEFRKTWQRAREDGPVVRT